MIRLQSLSMQNFRGIQSGKVDGLTDVNVLVGRNNSGKTTVVEAITRVAMLGGLTHDLFDRSVDGFWHDVRTAQTKHQGSVNYNNSVLWYRQDTALENLLSAVLIEKDNALKSEELSGRLTLTPRGAAYVPSNAIIERRPSSTNRPHSLDPGPRDLFCKSVTVLRPDDAFNSKVEQRFWPKLLSNRRDRLLTNILNDVFDLEAESFQLLPNGEFTVLFNEYSLPLDSQGDGTRAVMRTLMTLAMLKGTLLMLEEPECHQHPGSLERFAKALCSLAKAQEVQLIISTHSGECVRSFLKAADEVGTEGAVFHLTLTDGLQEARRLDQESVETLTSTGVDVRFLDLYA